MSAPAASAGGFSLFPSQRPPSRTQLQRPTGSGPSSHEPQSATRDSPSRNGRETPLGRTLSKREAKQVATNGRSSAMDGRIEQDGMEAPTIERVAVNIPPELPPRDETASSGTPAHARSNSRSSIAKPPIVDSESETQPQPALRSIFPVYNPNVPMDRQDYYPTQASPTHIPRAVISRPLYSPTDFDTPERQSPPQARTQPRPAVASPPVVLSPMSAASARTWGTRIAQEPPVVPPTSTTEELKGLWKVTNGWKASPSEGRVFCLKLEAEQDAPIYNLSSSTQPFYNLRLDPTSASAYVTVSRHDPNKLLKPGSAPLSPSASSTSTNKNEGKNWQEAMTTTLEEEARKHQPNDGLVALLYPTAAAKMALDKPGDMSAVDKAERECARLVWDDDSGNHFLVHPALAMPFCITIERNPAWSRTEYTLEHLESPQHLARLTRDGTGTGWLEIDTAIAAKIDSVYIVDVAVTALLLVAHGDDRFTHVEVFAPPPTAVLAGGSPRGSMTGERRSSSRLSFGGRRDKKKTKHEGGRSSRPRMEEFEMDLESQTSELGKSKSDKKAKDKDKTPGLIKLIKVIFKCLFWGLGLIFKTLAAIVAVLAKCVSSGK